MNSTSENIDSTSDRLQREHSRDLTDDDLAAITRENTEDDLANNEHYVTSLQTINNGESLLSPDQSSILSASQLVSDVDISSNQVWYRFDLLNSDQCLNQQVYWINVFAFE